MNRLFPSSLLLMLLTGVVPLAAPGEAAPKFCTRTGTFKLENKITLSGSAFLELHYGPPGYGEDPKVDEKMNQVFLKLDDPLRVIRKDGADWAPPEEQTPIVVRDIQLAPVHSEYPPVGKHVVVEGSLFGPETGYHHRDVLMSLSSFHTGGRIACDGSEVK